MKNIKVKKSDVGKHITVKYDDVGRCDAMLIEILDSEDVKVFEFNGRRFTRVKKDQIVDIRGFVKADL